MNQEIIKQAKDLFFIFQDELHDIKIMTIHSFCQNILLKFPFEAGIEADCEVIDENESKNLMKLAKNTAFELLNETDRDALRILSRLISSQTLEELVNKVLSSPARYIDFFKEHDDLDQYEGHLKHTFKLSAPIELSEDQVALILCTFKDVSLNKLEEIFLTKTGAIRKRLPSECADIARIVHANDINRKKRLLIRKTIAFLRIVKIIFNTYQDLKRQNNVIDFDDILYMTHQLLTKSNAKEFAVSKICNAIKCIMIDEAQDLSSIQWELISIFSEDILTGHHDDKTIFVVGDIKQSIYRFQGANYNSLLEFYRMCGEALNDRLKTVYLNISYRSLPAILDAVDTVFQNFELVQYQRHIPHRQDPNGIVKFIELTGKDNQENAEQITEYIKGLGAEDSDILILTRSRNDLSDNLLAALAWSGIRVAPPDRILFLQSQLIMDVLALVEFCIGFKEMETLNKYSLYCILKSSYIYKVSLGDHELYSIFNSGDILDYIKTKYAEHWEVMQKTLLCYNSNNLIAFFYYILSSIVRKQSEDDGVIIASFMEQCMKFSQQKSSNIRDFIKYIRQTDAKINIQNTKRDGISVSTIHGAKGLEAPVVCLLAFPLSADKAKTKMICNRDLFLLKPAQSDSFDEVQQILEIEYDEEKEELLRLLYVAMTRARDELHIIGQADAGFYPYAIR
jgi:ATP-dependent helicase/nuclease subunit A